MKTNLNRFTKTLQKIGFASVFMFALTLTNFSFAQDPNQLDYIQPQVVTPPTWAPPYDNPAGVQYYYIPDIECYYDVWHHEFVYMENGNWLFSPVLPPMYAGYDLFHGHIVMLDRQVHHPWMHHELYVSHYPRYYHNQVYPREAGRPHPYGFDENTRKPIYVPERDRDYHDVPPPARAQAIRYDRGREIGQPVRVEKDMMRPDHDHGHR